MKQAFTAQTFRVKSLRLIKLCDEIIADYQRQGLRLTLRQLYYQLVSRNVIPNTERSYKNVGALVSDARLCGLLDWDAIEDRVRQPVIWAAYDGMRECVEDALDGYRLPRWQGQDYYVELWVEKDALAGVLRPLAAEYHVTLMVNRGYSSQSAMYQAAQRFQYRQREELKSVGRKSAVLLYLGDHDPSGEDMVRDVEDRLHIFGVKDLRVTKVALTMEQIEQFNPPPNPAKLSDSRAEKYIAEHGDSSWELDALPPEELQAIVRRNILEWVDMEKMEAIKEREEEDKKALREAVDNLEDYR